MNDKIDMQNEHVKQTIPKNIRMMYAGYNYTEKQIQELIAEAQEKYLKGQNPNYQEQQKTSDNAEIPKYDCSTGWKRRILEALKEVFPKDNSIDSQENKAKIENIANMMIKNILDQQKKNNWTDEELEENVDKGIADLKRNFSIASKT
ncbi:MAG: hypothetical protein HC831_09925 [Chloroflexia bacterium]|nr:hypothetical protein [Chloroflexia bacterium]